MKSINKLALGVGVVAIGLFGCPKKTEQNPIMDETRARIGRVIPGSVAPTMSEVPVISATPEVSVAPETSISIAPGMTQNLNVLISDIKQESLEVCKNRGERLKALNEAIANKSVDCDKIQNRCNAETTPVNQLNKRKKDTLEAYEILKEKCDRQAIEIPILKENIELSRLSQKNDLLQRLSKTSKDFKEDCLLLEAQKKEEDRKIKELKRAATQCHSTLLTCQKNLNTLRRNRAYVYRKDLIRCTQWLSPLPIIKPLRSTNYQVK